MRLQKFLALSGLGSRRSCEEFITAGRVMVDGRPITKLGTTVDPQTQKISVDGQDLKPQRPSYYALHKPPDTVCSNRSQGGIPRVIDLISNNEARLFCIGRLDVASEGLLLLTNDGEFSNLVTHPRFKIAKTYRVQVKGSPSSTDIDQIRRGVWLSDGRTSPCRVRITSQAHHSTTLLVTVYEGKNRLVRRMLAHVGLPVKKLTRVQIGPIKLAKLKKGQFRRLTAPEVRELRAIAQKQLESNESPEPETSQSRSRKTPSSEKSPYRKKVTRKKFTGKKTSRKKTSRKKTSRKVTTRSKGLRKGSSKKSPIRKKGVRKTASRKKTGRPASKTASRPSKSPRKKGLGRGGRQR